MNFYNFSHKSHNKGAGYIYKELNLCEQSLSISRGKFSKTERWLALKKGVKSQKGQKRNFVVTFFNYSNFVYRVYWSVVLKAVVIERRVWRVLNLVNL